MGKRLRIWYAAGISNGEGLNALRHSDLDSISNDYTVHQDDFVIFSHKWIG